MVRLPGVTIRPMNLAERLVYLAETAEKLKAAGKDLSEAGTKAQFIQPLLE